MRIFGKKIVKIRLSVGGSAPEPLFASGGWGLRLQTPALPAYHYNFVKFIFSVKCVLLP